MQIYERIYSQMANRMAGLRSEEDVRFALESILTAELPSIGIEYKASYEPTIGSGRLDSLFGHLFIEYKRPGYFQSQRNFANTIDEKKRYLPELAYRLKCPVDRLAGVLFDGERIAFMRKDTYGKDRITELYPLSVHSIRVLIDHIHSLNFKALIAENILDDFGPQSEIAKKTIQLLWTTFLTQKDERTKMFFQEWIRLFGQTSGFGTGGEINLVAEAKLFGINLTKTVDYSSFVFVLHTYYSIVIKLTALFILQHSRKQEPHSIESFHLLDDLGKRDYIANMENGRLFKELGVGNFLEGDFFCWYVYEWTTSICDGLDNIFLAFTAYEPSSATLKPEAVRDLLKLLYENLLIKSLRHDLGEYYTPDWLAEYTIKESGVNVSDRVLDPSCGSGTFLVLMIRQKIEQMKQMQIDKSTIAESITSSVFGFDLNPLAVIASRTNYLLAISEYLEELPMLDIPVYLADSIMSPILKDGRYTYSLGTAHGIIDLSIPARIVHENKLSEVLAQIEVLVVSCAEGRIDDQSAKKHLLRFLVEMGLGDCFFEVIELYSRILDLEKKKWNRIWCKIIKNHFAPLMLRDFDVIIGNPPWLKWSSLPAGYREVVKDFCVKYDLFSSDRFVGGIESDVSTILLYSAAEKWLKVGGTLAMLITRTVFKTKSAEGFRKFCVPLNDAIKFKVKKVEDFTDIRPFEGAMNKPALVVLSRGNLSTTYPLPWIEWKSQGPKISENMLLSDVLSSTNRIEKVAYPIQGEGSPWITCCENDLPVLLKIAESEAQNYHARKGISTDLNGLYYGKIVRKRGGRHVEFENDPLLGRKTLDVHTSVLEKELVYPIARGREISAFSWTYTGLCGLLPQRSMDGYPVSDMMLYYPNMLEFFSPHADLLQDRASYRRYQKSRNAPYYSVWNVGTYSFAPYKVAWAEIAGIFETCVIESITLPYWAEPRVVIPDHKIYFVPTDSEIEAHYLSAFLNAPQISELIHAYIEKTQIGTHIMRYVHVPLFINEKWQIELAEVSQSAHGGRLQPDEAKRQISSILTNNYL